MMSCVTSTLGSIEPAPAQRATPPGWRDPRLWVGLLIVATSVIVGARVLARADESIAVWAAAGNLAAGQEVEPEDLMTVRLRFLDAADQGRYLSVGRPLPAARTLTRPVAEGELLPSAALGEPEDSGRLSVPVSVPALAVPPDLEPGSVVDVWVTTESSSGRAVSKPLLTEVVVLAAPVQVDAFGSSGDRQLVLAVDPDQEEALGRTLAAVGDSGLTIVGRG